MGTIVEKIREVCRLKKIPVAQLERDLHYGNGYLNPKKAKKVGSDRLKEIAGYLGVSVEYLMGETDTKKAPADSIDEREREAAILFERADPATKEYILTILRAAERRQAAPGAGEAKD